MVNAISTLIGEELEGEGYYGGAVASNNGYIYGIPCSARRVIKFNPLDKSMTHIGPDLGSGYKWTRCAMTDSGVIYCTPCGRRRGILKIDSNTDTVTVLDFNLLPGQGRCTWLSCAAALDGCIYFMPYMASRIIKLDPNNNDAISSVGDYLGLGNDKYVGTVVGIDGCVYGIPKKTTRVVRYDPINDTTSYVGEIADICFDCTGNGALGRDGCIYAITRGDIILKIDTTNNSHSFVGNSVESSHGGEYSWSDAVLGIDGCMYWHPYHAHRILSYDPHADHTSLVGDDFGYDVFKWYGGSLASDGVIYCFPRYATRILSIDPWKEYTSSLESKMKEHPEQIGCLFQPSDDIPNETKFVRAVTKFGYKKVMRVLEACMPPADRLFAVSNLHPFMIAACYKSSDISVIYHFLLKAPFLVPCISDSSNYEKDGSKKGKILRIGNKQTIYTQ